MDKDTIDLIREIKELSYRLGGIEDRLGCIESRVRGIEVVMGDIHSGVYRMDNHITWVEGIYDRVKHPFHYIMDLVGIRVLGFSRPIPPTLE